MSPRKRPLEVSGPYFDNRFEGNRPHCVTVTDDGHIYTLRYEYLAQASECASMLREQGRRALRKIVF